MAPRSRRTDDQSRRFGLHDLWRLAAWGLAAAAAAGVVVLAQQSETGSRRLTALLNIPIAPAPQAVVEPPPAPVDAEARAETRRLAEELRVLTAGQGRLLTRLAAIERSLDDVTGSVDRLKAVPPPAPVPPPAASAASPPPVAVSPPPDAAPEKPAVPPVAAAPPLPPPIEVAPPVDPPAPARSPAADPYLEVSDPSEEIPLPLPRPIAADLPPVRLAARDMLAPDTAAVRTEFGVDLGKAASAEGVMALWNSLQDELDIPFENLTPLMRTRGSRSGSAPDIRLIAGPFANAAAAVRLCVTLNAAGRQCVPARYAGEPLLE